MIEPFILALANMPRQQQLNTTAVALLLITASLLWLVSAKKRCANHKTKTVMPLAEIETPTGKTYYTGFKAVWF
ncbi:MAG: hypothetical protein GQ569_00385 [Methylococcaceae bacterium]|nr:hypothetical protein [Methylococcaceae bacterium]